MEKVTWMDKVRAFISVVFAAIFVAGTPGITVQRNRDMPASRKHQQLLLFHLINSCYSKGSSCRSLEVNGWLNLLFLGGWIQLGVH